MNLTLHDGRFTKKTSLPENKFDYGKALRENLIIEYALHEEFIKACDEALELIELIDQPGFWEDRSL